MSDLPLLHTTAELDELPMGSVIRTGTARVACKSWRYPEGDRPSHMHDDWYETGNEFEVQSDEFDDFPHQVLYRGGTPPTEAAMTVEDAELVLRTVGQMTDISGLDTNASLYRRARFYAQHETTGSYEQLAQVEQAADVLRASGAL